MAWFERAQKLVSADNAFTAFLFVAVVFLSYLLLRCNAARIKRAEDDADRLDRVVSQFYHSIIGKPPPREPDP